MKKRTTTMQAAARGAWGTVLIALSAGAGCDQKLCDQDDKDAWMLAGYGEGFEEGRKEAEAEWKKKHQEEIDKLMDEIMEDEVLDTPNTGATIAIEDELLRTCWDRRTQEATPVRLDDLEEGIHDICLEMNGCDIERVVRTYGCWAEAELKFHGESEALLCGFYDRPLASGCGDIKTGLCSPGWEFVDCHYKQEKPGQKAAKKPGLWEYIKKRRGG